MKRPPPLVALDLADLDLVTGGAGGGAHLLVGQVRPNLHAYESPDVLGSFSTHGMPLELHATVAAPALHCGTGSHDGRGAGDGTGGGGGAGRQDAVVADTAADVPELHCGTATNVHGADDAVVAVATPGLPELHCGTNITDAQPSPPSPPAFGDLGPLLGLDGEHPHPTSDPHAVQVDGPAANADLTADYAHAKAAAQQQWR